MNRVSYKLGCDTATFSVMDVSVVKQNKGTLREKTFVKRVKLDGPGAYKMVLLVTSPRHSDEDSRSMCFSSSFHEDEEKDDDRSMLFSRGFLDEEDDNRFYKEFDFVSKSGEVVLGDPCYSYPKGDSWDKFLRMTNDYFNETQGFEHLGTGADGSYTVTLEWSKVK